MPELRLHQFRTAENCHKCAADLSAPVGSESDPFAQFSPGGPYQRPYQMRPAKSGGFSHLEVVLGLFGGMVLLAVGAGVLASMVRTSHRKDRVARVSLAPRQCHRDDADGTKRE